MGWGLGGRGVRADGILGCSSAAGAGRVAGVGGCGVEVGSGVGRGCIKFHTVPYSSIRFHTEPSSVSYSSILKPRTVPYASIHIHTIPEVPYRNLIQFHTVPYRFLYS